MTEILSIFIQKAILRVLSRFWGALQLGPPCLCEKSQRDGAGECKPHLPGSKRDTSKSAGTLFSDTCRVGCLLLARPSANSASRRKNIKHRKKKTLVNSHAQFFYQTHLQGRKWRRNSRKNSSREFLPLTPVARPTSHAGWGTEVGRTDRT